MPPPLQEPIVWGEGGHMSRYANLICGSVFKSPGHCGNAGEGHLSGILPGGEGLRAEWRG